MDGANYSCGCLCYVLALFLGLASAFPRTSQVVAVILIVLGTLSMRFAHKRTVQQWKQLKQEIRDARSSEDS